MVEANGSSFEFTQQPPDNVGIIDHFETMLNAECSQATLPMVEFGFTFERQSNVICDTGQYCVGFHPILDGVIDIDTYLYVVFNPN